MRIGGTPADNPVAIVIVLSIMAVTAYCMQAVLARLQKAPPSNELHTGTPLMSVPDAMTLIEVTFAVALVVIIIIGLMQLHRNGGGA